MTQVTVTIDKARAMLAIDRDLMVLKIGAHRFLACLLSRLPLTVADIAALELGEPEPERRYTTLDVRIIARIHPDDGYALLEQNTEKPT